MVEVGINTLAMVAASLTAIVAQESQKLHLLIEKFHEAAKAGKPLDAHDIINEITAVKTNLFQATSDSQTAVNDVAKARLEIAKETEPEIKTPVAPEVPTTGPNMTAGAVHTEAPAKEPEAAKEPEKKPDPRSSPPTVHETSTAAEAATNEGMPPSPAL